VILIQPTIIETEQDMVKVSQREKERGSVGNMSYVAADPETYSTEPPEKFKKKKYKYVGSKEPRANPVRIPAKTNPPGDGEPAPTIMEFEQIPADGNATLVVPEEMPSPP
jgi:hypothetical protein